MLKWFGSTRCDICGLHCEDVLIDAKTKKGPWATMCENCFKKYGIKIAPGFGQKYKRDNNNFIKIEG